MPSSSVFSLEELKVLREFIEKYRNVEWGKKKEYIIEKIYPAVKDLGGHQYSSTNLKQNLVAKEEWSKKKQVCVTFFENLQTDLLIVDVSFYSKY